MPRLCDLLACQRCSQGSSQDACCKSVSTQRIPNVLKPHKPEGMAEVFCPVHGNQRLHQQSIRRVLNMPLSENLVHLSHMPAARRIQWLIQATRARTPSTSHWATTGAASGVSAYSQKAVAACRQSRSQTSPTRPALQPSTAETVEATRLPVRRRGRLRRHC
jgi:hypothetical protein